MIDFHTHIFHPKIRDNREEYVRRDAVFAELYADPRAKMATAEELIAKMDEQEVEASVALNVGWSSHQICQETNDYILESAARYSGRLFGFGMAVFDGSDDSIKEVERCHKRGMKGIGEIRPSPRMLRHLDSLEGIIQKLISLDLILLTHSSEPAGHVYPGKGDITPELLYPLITRFPELKLVCAHWGGGLPFYALMPEVHKALENVYFDTAASPYLYKPQIYTQVTSLCGADKILFGTDYPLLAPRRYIKEIDSQDLPQNIKDQILSGNARRLLHLKGE
jgi:predicted TIM-barrel fold metal-dependent hydrolase